jgi:hypothetical protein
MDPRRRDEAKAELCALLGMDVDKVLQTLRELCRERDRYRSDCELLTRRCDSLEAMQKLICCPGNTQYSQFTLDGYSADNLIELDKVVKGLGGDYVDDFPVPPGKKIRLITEERPGFAPEWIRMDFSLANDGVNYLDIKAQLFIIPGGQEPLGAKFGPRYRGNQFLHKDGRQEQVAFPLYRDMPLVVGSNEQVAIDLEHSGPNNLNSAYITFYHDANRFYRLCRQSCDPATCG